MNPEEIFREIEDAIEYADGLRVHYKHRVSQLPHPYADPDPESEFNRGGEEASHKIYNELIMLKFRIGMLLEATKGGKIE